MKTNKKRAFTIVELIIVIAVIGVLAAILIPTFANVIEKANAKSALSDAKNTLTSYLAEKTESEALPENMTIFVHKAGAFYVYGYSKDIVDTNVNGQLMQSTGNPFTGWAEDQLAAFIAAHGETTYVPGTPYTGDKFFYLPENIIVPSLSPVKGARLLDMDNTLVTSYNYLSDNLEDELPGATEIFEGYLLPGKYVVSGEAQIGEGGTTQYTVTFAKGEQSSATVPSPVSVDYGTTLATLATNYTATCDGYTFRGWSIDEDNVNDQTSTVTSDMTVYACWLEVPPTMHLVTLNAAGGTFSALDGWTVSGDTATREFSQGTDISSVLAGIIPTKTENTFGGWGVDTSLPISVNAPVTYTANWSETKYAVTFENNAPEGETVSGMPAATTLAAEAEINLADYAPTCTGGYVLDGWRYNSTDYGKTATIEMPSHAITIAARWSLPSFTIEYYEDEYATDAVATEGINMTGTTTTLRAALTRAHYTFEKWDIDGTLYNAGASYDYSGVTAGATIEAYGTWTEDAKYNVVYDGNGNASFENPITHAQLTQHTVNNLYTGDTHVVLAYNTTAFTTLVDSTRTFEGWNTMADGTGYDYAAGDEITINNVSITLYAQWSDPVVAKQAYQITVTLNDTFNNRAAYGTQTITTPELADGETFTIDNSNFSTYITGAKPYNTTNYFAAQAAEQVFTVSGGAISPATYTANVYPYETTGEGEFILVYNITGLNACSSTAAHATKNYKLKANITSLDTNFNAIGWENTDEVYSGIFDGAGYTLALKMYFDNGSNVGLIAVNEGTIKNVNFNVSQNTNAAEDGAQIGGTACVGAIAGQNKASGRIYNCYVYQTAQLAMIASEDSLGGIVGYNYGTVEYCAVNSTKTVPMKSSYSGAIAGQNEGNISKCMAYSDPCAWAAGEAVGGIAGANSGTISECGYTGRVAYGQNYANTYGCGGIVGYDAGGTIENCYYANFKSGNAYIEGNNASGGLVGHGVGTTLRYCYVYTATVGEGSNRSLGIGYRETTCYVTSSYACGTSSANGLTKGVTSWATLKSNASAWDWTNIWSDDASPFTLRRAKTLSVAVV